METSAPGLSGLNGWLILAVSDCRLFDVYGRRWFSKCVAFPVAFLIFMVPVPSAVLDWAMSFFQQASAVTAYGFLTAAGMPLFREDMVFHMPDFSLMVAKECSGIHSTLVFIIDAVLGSHLFLRSGWKRALLVMFAIPLAIVRNAFRIFVIAEMCVHISHDMINSFIHRRGGPIFYALSFIPYFILILVLRKWESGRSKRADLTAAVSE